MNGDDGVDPEDALSMAFCSLEQLELLWEDVRWK